MEVISIAATNMTQLIKQIAAEAVAAGKPCDIVTGTVVSVKPLKIKVSQKLAPSEEFLLLGRNVSDYETEITLPGSAGKSKVTIHNAMKKGDTAVMIRQAGGQRYLVIDKVVG